MKKNIVRLGKIISDVLDFREIEEGKIKLDIKTHSINSAALEVCAMFEKRALEKEIELRKELDESLPPFEFDYDSIMQVLINLMDNAIKFTEEGYVKIKTELRKILR